MKIEFIPASKEVELTVEKPEPSKKYIPEWYKKAKTFDQENLSFDEDYNIKNKGIKSCMPFFDALSAGYIQTTWTDIYVEVKNNKIMIATASGPEIVQTRESTNTPIDSLFYPLEFLWKMPWLPKTPKGYSTLVCHPNNRLDLPFISLSGVLDSDKYYHTPFGNFPFYVKNNFSGLIPVGTPMYQLIPIKRDSWQSIKNNFQEDSHTQRYSLMQRHFYGAYKKYFWEKKNYS